LLLNFNENVLDFDSSIVSEAAKTKVEGFFRDLSNTIDTFSRPSSSSDSSKERILAAETVLEAGEEFVSSLASTVELGCEMEIVLPNISLAVVKRQSVPSQPSLSQWSSHGLEVELADQAAITAQDSSISLAFTAYHNLGDLMTSESQVSSPVLSVTALGETAGMEYRSGRRWTELEEPVHFSVRHGPVPHHSAVSCVYWHFPSSSWATHGCSSRSLSPSSTSCSCSHLTTFALLVLPPPSPVTWAPLTFFSAAPAVSLGPPVTPTPSPPPSIRRVTTEGDLQGLLYSAAPSIKYREKVRVTRRQREEDREEKVVVLEVEQAGLASDGVYSVIVILPLTVIFGSFLLWRKRKRNSPSSLPSLMNYSKDDRDWDQFSCYDDMFLNCLEEDMSV